MKTFFCPHCGQKRSLYGVRHLRPSGTLRRPPLTWKQEKRRAFQMF